MEEEPPEEDILSILVATDNHVGYLEKDPIRGDDSFNTFEEILQHAHREEVDMILLGGDLFHENKPSRQSIHRVTTLLREYCFGDKPVEVEFLSDQKENFHTGQFNTVNYEDPNLNVAIPVYSIHGNHDDPAGRTGLCALDLLSASGVINYFGKSNSLEEIIISPLLMRKGNTKLAIYGLGSIRDERLHRLFINKKVKCTRPDQDRDEWFNIFVIHQNRVKRGKSETSFIPEEVLPEFIDLIIWGHEHDCQTILKNNSVLNAYVLQPGSSVATSLSEGETEPKHCFKIQIYKKNFNKQDIPLTTVRPFLFKTVSLIDADVLTEKDALAYLQYNVDQMISEANQERERNPNAPELPIIRLRYDHHPEMSMINPIRFGNEYSSRVANPRDILHPLRKKKYAAFDPRIMAGTDDNEEEIRSQSEMALKILKESNQELSLIPEQGLAIATEEYVDKLEADAISEYIKHSLASAKRFLLENSKPGDDLFEKLRIRKTVMAREEGDMATARKKWEDRRKEKSEKSNLLASSGEESESEKEPEPVKPKRGRGSRGGRGGASASRGGRGGTNSRAARGSRAKASNRAVKGNLDAFLTPTRSTPIRSTRSTNKPILDISDDDDF